jgi:hypothetical protein
MGVPPVQLLSPAGVAFLLVSLLALAGGLFLDRLLPPDAAAAWHSPPALQALLAAQAAFLLLFGPFMAGGSSVRRERPARNDSADAPEPAGCPLRIGGTWALQFLLLAVMSAPLYLAAAWFADATAQDALRGLLYLAGVAAAAWGLGLWARAGGLAATLVCLFVASAALAAPVALYFLAELAERSAGWLYLASPTTCALAVAASRQAAWLPQPLWAWAIWPAVGAALVFARLAVGARS